MSADRLAAAKAIGIVDVLVHRGVVLKRQGRELIGPCPVCGGVDRFGVNLTKQIWNCRGCAKGGDVIALVQHIDGIDFPRAIDALTNDNTIPRRVETPRPVRKVSKPIEPSRDWWSEARPVVGTLAETYLVGRGITELPPDADECLRFHPEIVFGRADDDAWRYVPALVGRVRDVVSNKPIGLQRIGLTADGRKIGPMALGPIGGGAVKLWPDEDIGDGLVIAEGIETALAASVIEFQATLLRPIRATLSASNLETLPVLPGIQALTLVVDADDSNAGQKAAAACAERWSAAGIEVTRLTPSTGAA